MQNIMQIILILSNIIAYLPQSISLLAPCDPNVVINMFDPEGCLSDECGFDSLNYASCSALAEIYPSTTESVSELVEIFYNRDDVAISYAINFIPRGSDCINPTISFSFVDVNNDDIEEYITIFYDEAAVTKCSMSRRCELVNCLTDLPLPTTTTIPVDTPHTITILTGWDIEYENGDCVGPPPLPIVPVNTTISANLTITCDITPSHNPTKMPSINPSVSPFESKESSDSDDVFYAADVNGEKIGMLNESDQNVLIEFTQATMINLSIFVVNVAFLVCNIIVMCKNQKGKQAFDNIV